MIAKSVYISNLEHFKVENDVDLYFTSFHIEEEFNEEYKSKVKYLLNLLKDKKVIIDISPRGIEYLGYDSIIDFINEYPIYALRFDFGYQDDEILEVSKYCKVALNASTCSLETIEKFKDINCIAIHNFYPRRETGLDKDYFIEQNHLFNQYNIPVYAFISGDTDLRGPLYDYLVTLESHRNQSCYEQYLDMKQYIDHIIISEGITKEQFQLIQDTEKDHIIRLYASLEEDYHHLYNKVFTNRKDAPNDLIRVIESRNYATQGKLIKPNHCIERKLGSITIDNENYLRYSSEIQITKKDYPQDNKVNVIGNILDKHFLKYIKRNSKFMLKNIKTIKLMKCR